MATPLSDLDELVLRCRDEKARALIAEAVASYRAGAFRSSIVAAWIAVCFDFMEKLRELALSGNATAEAQVAELERIRRTESLSLALKFERELLALARDQFELISPIEYVDLERLQADRNRCAHPSLIAEDTGYAPSAELARLHIHSAVEHVLRHPPVQGKHALERLCREIESDYFPVKADAALAVLAHGPLRRPRPSLVRSIVVILLKQVLKEASYPARPRRVAALKAIAQLQAEHYAKTLQEKLSPLIRAIADPELPIAMTGIIAIPDAWRYLEEDVVQRLKMFVKNLPAGSIEYLEDALSFAPLRPEACQRASRATRKELSQSFFFTIPAEIADRYIVLYLASDSFDVANAVARDIASNAGDFSAAQVTRLIEGMAKNSQIAGSFGLGAVVGALRVAKSMPLADFEALLETNGFQEFMQAADDET